MTTHLTDTQKQTIRIALAKYEGWSYEGCWFDPHNRRMLRTNICLPDYPNSLDACHEIELKLTDLEHAAFESILADLCIKDGQAKIGIWWRGFVSASSEHRSLALFLALNLGELGD